MTFLSGEENAAQEEVESTYIPSVTFTFRNHLIEVIEELRVKRVSKFQNVNANVMSIFTVLNIHNMTRV